MAENIRKLLNACGYFDYGLDKITLIEMSMEIDSSFTLTGIKEELLAALHNSAFDWVTMAIDTRFIYTSQDLPSIKLCADELLIFTDSFSWDMVSHVDAQLSIVDKERLKDQIRNINVQEYINVNELIDSDGFNWLPFEVKHAYKMNFGEMQYKHEDIIYHLKSTVWLYLFPDALDKNRIKSIGESSHQILKSQTSNDGWIDMEEMLAILNEPYPKIDLFELSKVDWRREVNHKVHFRNPFTLGFKRWNN